MNLGEFSIDDFVPLAVSTVSPTTAAEQDADEAPTYRIYEQGEESPIATGTLAKFDDANTVGSYLSQVQATAALGFGAGKSYSVVIRAAVDGVAASTWRSFRVSTLASNVTAILTDTDRLGVPTDGTIAEVLDAAAAVVSGIAGVVNSVKAVTDVLGPRLPGSGTLSTLDGDDLTGLANVSSGQPRSNRRPSPGFSYKISRRADGTHKVTHPIRLTPGAVANVYPFIDMSPLFGPDDNVDTVGTPVVSAGSVTAAAEGPRDTGFYLKLGGTATASESRTITVPITMDSGTTVNVVIDVEVFAS